MKTIEKITKKAIPLIIFSLTFYNCNKKEFKIYNPYTKEIEYFKDSLEAKKWKETYDNLNYLQKEWENLISEATISNLKSKNKWK